ncbi:MAG: mechanosensitive ion channel domain-containing protein [bacterium]
MAAIFIVGSIAMRIKFRGDPIAERLKRPSIIFYVYVMLFGITVLAKLYWLPGYRFVYLVSLFVLVLAVLLAVSVAFFDYFLGRVRRITVPAIVRDVVMLVIYAVVIIIVVGQAGVDVTSIITTSAVLTAVIGFALQDLLSNIISGLAIEIERPFKVGDFVKFNDQEGKVLEINWRSTKIETLHRDTVIIPNNVATRSPIINFSAPTRIHRRKIAVGLRYEAAPNRVRESLLTACRGCEGVLTEPEPYVVLKEYADFSINYKLFFFITDFLNRERIENRVMTRLWYQLRRDGLSIPFPIRDLNVREVKPEDNELERKRKIEGNVALLRSVPFLEVLSPDELNTLASRLRTEFYARGEPVIRQGGAGSSFYIITDGEVEVLVREREGAKQRRVSLLGDHNFFGEMSLMTGAERAATVVATRDSELAVIDKVAFGDIISGNDALVESISARLLARQKELEQARAEAVEEDAAKDAQEQKTLMSRIKNFFQM